MAAGWCRYDSFNERFDAEFQGATYCEGKKPEGLGRDKCESVRGCCWVAPESEARPETERFLPARLIPVATVGSGVVHLAPLKR